jgi:hypothetical protein
MGTRKRNAGPRRTVADMARDAARWEQGKYTPSSRADLARIKRHAAILRRTASG